MTNPFNYGTPVPYRKFVGRRRQIEAIADDLANSEGHSHAVIGGRRFGKSSFLEALQHSLIERLNQAGKGSWVVFPILINLKRLEKESADGVFGLILNTLYQYLTSKRLRNEIDLSLELDLADAKLGAFENENRNECPLKEFEGIVDDFLELFADSYIFLRLVLLMDEAEAVVHKEWTESLFDKLRALVYDGFLRKYMRLVIAGSSEITEVRQSGSPLFNMLKLNYLESLSKTDIMEIICWMDDASKEMAGAVFQQCGGHPFIAQYLMHHFWEKGLSSKREDVVLRLADKFKHECHADLYRWQREIGEAGQITYNSLEKQKTWATEAWIRKTVNNPEIKIDLSLVALCNHGLAIHDGEWRRFRYSGDLFRSWFNDNALQSITTEQTPSDKLPHETEINYPRIRIHLKDQVFPTVYCYSLTKEEYPLVSCEIDNTAAGCSNRRVSVEAEIQGYSDACSDTVEILPGRSKTISLLPTITHEARLSLNEIRRVGCRVIVRAHERAGAKKLHDKTYALQLHAANTALLAVRKAEGGVEDLADYLTVLVTPHRPEIEKVIKKAAIRHPDKRIVGRQGAESLEKAREIARSQAKAFFDTLKYDYRLLYTDSSLNFGKKAGQFTQRVRLPIESLEQDQTQANCIDGTVLFASLLENAGMEPLLAIVPGHSFVGWRIREGRDEYDFLETTMIGHGDFKKALEKGNEKYNNAVEKGLDNRPIFDPAGFIRIVDVTACRRKEINPMM